MLDLGADDFLVKPVALELVVARLRAILRRVSGSAVNVIQRGPLEYDLKNQICRVQGSNVELTAREHQLLQRFISAGLRVYQS
jgi:DNA-binding response OmpR family regulator